MIVCCIDSKIVEFTTRLIPMFDTSSVIHCNVCRRSKQLSTRVHLHTNYSMKFFFVFVKCSRPLHQFFGEIVNGEKRKEKTNFANTYHVLLFSLSLSLCRWGRRGSGRLIRVIALERNSVFDAGPNSNLTNRFYFIFIFYGGGGGGAFL